MANFADFFHVPIPDAAGPYWSLAVEEQFYLVWPWLVLWLDHRRLAWLTVAIVVAEPLLRFGTRSQELTVTWYRMDGLALGAFIAIWFSEWNGKDRRASRLALTLAGAALLVTLAGIPIGLLHDGPASTSLRVTQAVLIFGAALVVAVASAGNRALGFLRGRATTVTALLSYCLYLIHKPVISAVALLLRQVPLTEKLEPETGLIVRILCSLIVAYGIAAASRRFLELPCIRLAQRL